MHWINLLHEFHNLSWITEINELFHDILIYWNAHVYARLKRWVFNLDVYWWSVPAFWTMLGKVAYLPLAVHFDILGFSTGQNFNIAGDMKHYDVTKACSGTENLNH